MKKLLRFLVDTMVRNVSALPLIPAAWSLLRASVSVSGFRAVSDPRSGPRRVRAARQRCCQHSLNHRLAPGAASPSSVWRTGPRYFSDRSPPPLRRWNCCD